MTRSLTSGAEQACGVACLPRPQAELIRDPRAAKPSAARKAKIPADPLRESHRGALWIGLSLIVAFFCLFQALPRWSRTDGLSSSRTRHAVAPSSLDTNIASDYRVGAENYKFFNIEDIRPGQLVLASNPATGQLEPRRVLQTFQRTTYHLRYLTFESTTGVRQTFETTDEHPFWSQSEFRWVSAGDLQPGDRVIDPHGAQSLLIATHREPHPEGVPVYNFEVEGFHSYFVAAKGPGGQPVLVHNAECAVGTPNRSISRPSNNKFRNGWDRIFGNSQRAKGVTLTIKEPRILSQAGFSEAELSLLQKHFRIKSNAVRSAARRGQLKWSPGTEDVRISELQASHRSRVAERFERMFGQKLNMDTLNADHPIDLIVGGAADQRLRMINESINKSFGASFLQAGRKLNLQPGQMIDEIIFQPR